MGFPRTSTLFLPYMRPSSSPYAFTDPRAASSSAYFSPSNLSRTYQRPLPPSNLSGYRRDMSGFLSSEAEQALQAEEAEAQRLFYEAMVRNQQQTRSQYPYGSGSTYASTIRPAGPYIQQPTWPAAYPASTMANYPPMPPTPVVPSSPSYMVPSSSEPGQPWSALNPEELRGSRSRAASGSDYSTRSSSPNPAELHNFGYMLPDGRSWRCAHPGCNSQAVFTRGCDLRKHFRRHTKSLFCRHEDCLQSVGGFSSKKDRDRHEAKHRPGVSCQWEGCERVFSRVDNMKDHMRRIHKTV